MCDSRNSKDSIGSIGLYRVDSTDFIDSKDFIDFITLDAILVPHKRSPTFTPHTKGARAARAPTTIPMGRALRARPIGTVVFPFVWAVDDGGRLCGACVCVCACLALGQKKHRWHIACRKK